MPWRSDTPSFSSDHPLAVELRKPAKMTVQKGSQYKKKPFVGGEVLVMHGAYVGKRGSIIFMFNLQQFNPEIDVVEVSISEATDLLTGFSNHWMAFLDADQAVVEKLIEKEAEEKAVEEDRLNSNELFGSW